MNQDVIDFQKALAFIEKLRSMEEPGQGFGYPFSILYRDEFENLEKFVRRGFYGHK